MEMPGDPQLPPDPGTVDDAGIFLLIGGKYLTDQEEVQPQKSLVSELEVALSPRIRDNQST